MKTPDKIMKGLECCCNEDDCPSECPYFRNCDGDGFALERDAMAYIQQLEEERDAYREAVKNIAGCLECVHFFDVDDDPPVCKACKRRSNWQWRGAAEDEMHEYKLVHQGPKQTEAIIVEEVSE